MSKGTIVSYRPSTQGRAALSSLIKYMRDRAPAGVRITINAVIENAILEKYQEIEQKKENRRE